MGNRDRGRRTHAAQHETAERQTWLARQLSVIPMEAKRA